MRRRNEFWGWGVVVFFGGVLVTMIVSSTQPRAVNYIAMLPEAQLEQAARTTAGIEGGLKADMTYLDSAIVSYTIWRTARGIYSPRVVSDFPVYVYRAYGDVIDTTASESKGFQVYQTQKIEISLDARTGMLVSLVKMPYNMNLDPLDSIAYKFEATLEPLP